MAPVLVTGESGTGKELFSQLIHDASSRSAGPMIRVNCAALSETLIESELFGHERGSFTDAVAARQGRFELATDGTLLLDEISEIPIKTQAKLLRVLESDQFERVGGSKPIQQNARIVAASNRELAQQIKEGGFRLDLYHRINVVQIAIPALRDRCEDIPVLAMHFVERFRNENSIHIEGFEPAAMKRLASHCWPGNVRELRNVVHRACILCDSPLIGEEFIDFSQELTEPDKPSNLPEHWLHTDLADVEKEIIVAALNKYGNQRIVAEKLGVSPRTLTNKIRQYRETNRQVDAA